MFDKDKAWSVVRHFAFGAVAALATFAVGYSQSVDWSFLGPVSLVVVPVVAAGLRGVQLWAESQFKQD